jgi:hypothetical protein
MPQKTTQNAIFCEMRIFTKLRFRGRPMSIFNLRILNGIFPSQLKRGRTVPILKAGSPLLCDNYSPISLLSTLSNLLEKIICKQLVHHLESNNLIYQHQYSFQHGKPTEHNLIQLINFISSALNDKKNSNRHLLRPQKSFRCLLAQHSSS